MAGPEAIAVGRAVAGAAHGRSAPFLAKEKLRAKHTELAAGVRTTANYTVGQYLKDWLETLNTQAESTVTGYRIMARQLIELIGNVKLADLTVRDVQFALGKLATFRPASPEECPFGAVRLTVRDESDTFSAWLMTSRAVCGAADRLV